MGWVRGLDRLAGLIVGPLIIGAIRIYQFLISNRLPRVCQYTPSCSRYAILAIRRFGLFHAAHLTWKRLEACNGGRFQGLDPPGHGIPGQPIQSSERKMNDD